MRRAAGRSGVAMALAVAVAAGLFSAGCASRARPALVDAETAMRVKTALLNDPAVGLEDVRVDVVEGVAYLSGRLSSEQHRARVIELARATPGVRDVQIEVEIRPEIAALRRRLNVAPPDERPGRRRILGLGAAVRLTGSTSQRLDNAVDFTPLFSLAPGEGWGPTIGLGWSSRRLVEGVAGQPPLARVTIRPIMGGLAYTKPLGASSLSLSVVGGYAFNALNVDDGRTGPLRAIAVSNAFVVRPSATLKYGLLDRVGLQLSAGYLIARPRVTFASDSAIRSERINADALVISVGAVYWIF